MSSDATKPAPDSGAPKAPARTGLGLAPPKRKPRKPFLDWLAWVGVKCALLAFRVPPAFIARAMGRGLGWTIWALSKRYRNQAHRHMDIAYRDEVSTDQKSQWCKQYFKHLGLIITEFARLKYITPDNVKEYVDLSDCKKLDDLLAKGNGKGLICVPAHHGNWELMGYVLAMQKYPIKSVARPLDNPRLNDLIMRIRSASGNEILEKWRVLWKLKKLLDKGAMVTISIDQNGGVAGQFSPMFGTLASTVTSPAELHLASGAPIVILSVNRLPGGKRHKLNIWEVIEQPKSEDHAADVATIITRINAAYEKSIRQYPEQWLWVHKRWKTRPPGETVGADGLPPRCGSGGEL